VNSLLPEFAKRNAQVLGVSTDSIHTNRQYAQSMGGIHFPLLSDWLPHGAQSQRLGAWVDNLGCASRTTVVIDGQGIIRDIHTNPLGEDRDFGQTLALIDALEVPAGT
jgi:alkyl hydroperoxide reductase subunit AhpC